MQGVVLGAREEYRPQMLVPHRTETPIHARLGQCVVRGLRKK